MIRAKTAANYNLVMKNRPGELAKLTKFLSDAGVNVSTLRIARLGGTTSVQFSTATECALPAKFRKSLVG